MGTIIAIIIAGLTGIAVDRLMPQVMRRLHWLATARHNRRLYGKGRPYRYNIIKDRLTILDGRCQWSTVQDGFVRHPSGIGIDRWRSMVCRPRPRTIKATTTVKVGNRHKALHK